MNKVLLFVRDGPPCILGIAMANIETKRYSVLKTLWVSICSVLNAVPESERARFATGNFVTVESCLKIYKVLVIILPARFLPMVANCSENYDGAKVRLCSCESPR